MTDVSSYFKNIEYRFSKFDLDFTDEEVSIYEGALEKSKYILSYIFENVERLGKLHVKIDFSNVFSHRECGIEMKIYIGSMICSISSFGGRSCYINMLSGKNDYGNPPYEYNTSLKFPLSDKIALDSAMLFIVSLANKFGEDI